LWFTDSVLILVRHGRTPANAAGLLQGRLDQDLDEVGERQAVAVAKMIGPVDEVISSPLRRARATAEAFGRPVDIDDRWIELAYGDYEGKPFSGRFGEVWRRWYEDPTYAPPGGGESLIALDQRVREALAELEKAAADRDVVVVSHVSPIKAAVAAVLHANFDFAFRSHLSHAAVCRVEFRQGGAVLHSFNETAPDEP
jgi:alpha-ribazole phosphatase